MSKARSSSHYEQTLALGRPGLAGCSRSPTTSTTWNSPGRASGSVWCASAPSSSRITRTTSTRPGSTSASCSASRTIPPRTRSRTGSASATASRPVPDADHFMAKLASRRYRPGQARHRAPGRGTPARRRRRPLPPSRRGGRAGRRSACSEDGEGKPLVFRDSMIENIRGLVDVVPRLNIFGDDTACPPLRTGEGEDRQRRAGFAAPLAGLSTPPPAARVKRDADALMEQFAGYFPPVAEPAAEPARKAA